MSTSAAMTSLPAPPYPPPPPQPPPPPPPFPNLATWEWDYFFGPYPPSPPPQTREYHPSSPSSLATALPHLPLSRVSSSSSSSSSSFVSTELELPPPPPPPLPTLPAQPLLRRVALPSSSSFSTELLPPPPPPRPLLRRVPSSSSSSSFSTELLLLPPPPPPFPLSPNSATWDYYAISSTEDAPEQPPSLLDSSDYFISIDPDTPPHTGLQTQPRPPPSSIYGDSFVSDHRRGGSSQPASSESVAALATVTVSDTAAACAVCTDSLPLASTASRLPCGHLYHSHCIVQWLLLRNSCPVCRRSIPMFPATFTTEEIAPSPLPLDPQSPTATDQEEASPSPPPLRPQPTTASDRRGSLPGARRIRRICRRLLSYME